MPVNSMSWLITLTFAAYAVFLLSGLWKAFEKAGYEGWKAWIPVYNIYIMAKIARMPEYYLLGLLVPVLNIALWMKLHYDSAKSYGATTGGAVTNAIVPGLGWPIIGWNKIYDIEYSPGTEPSTPSQEVSQPTG